MERFWKWKNFWLNKTVCKRLLIRYKFTVKTFYKEDGYYRLQPENDEMDPILVHGNLQILGKVFGVFRFYN